MEEERRRASDEALNYIKEKLGDMKESIAELKGKVDELVERLDTHYVSKAEFEPIKKTVYGGVGITLIAVFSALVGMVVLKR